MWLWMIAAVAAYFVKGLCGFANTLIFTSILGFGNNNVNISPVELVLGFPSNIIMTFKNRKKLKLNVWLPSVILVLVGSVPGALLLKNIDASIIKIIFGAAIILVGIENILREYDKLHIKESKIMLIIVGLISGALCGMFGVGALLAAYIGRVSEDSDTFKANISAVFIADNIFRIVLYSIMGIITGATLLESLELMPFMLAGLFAGIKCSRFINERLAKILVVILLVLSGTLLIVNNL